MIYSYTKLFLLVLMAGSLSSAQGADFSDFLTTKSVVLRVGKKTTETRKLVTTDGAVYLDQIAAEIPEPNASIVRLIMSYPQDGSHSYWWPKKKEDQYDGSTTDVLLGNQMVMKGEVKGRTFCCGLTLEVFYRYLNRRADLAENVTTSGPANFKSLWFCKKIFSPGPLDAMNAFSIGKEVTNLDDALPGDFVQLWRNDKTGHSVIFVNWLLDENGKRVGLQYWSSQLMTKGIGFYSEAFGNAPKQINLKYFSLSRPLVNN